MKKFLWMTAVVLPGLVGAQTNNNNNKEQERIIITKKGGENGKLNIVIDGENITVNGKPVDKNGEGDVTVNRLRIKDFNNFRGTIDLAKGGNDSEVVAWGFSGQGAPNKAMLGVTTEKTEEGVTIKSVNEESAAKKAGLKEGDIIIKVDGKVIEAPDQLSESLKDKKPGDKVTVTYKREGKTSVVTPELTKWNAPRVMTFNRNGTNFSGPDINFEEFFPRDSDNSGRLRIYGAPALGIHPSGPKLGVTVQDLDKGSGVTITELQKGSDADKAGLKEGDIIREANGIVVEGTDDLLAQTRKAKAGSSLKLKVDRNGKAQNIEVVFSKKIKTAEL